MENQKRHSGIELLRILCILGIIVLHLYGPYKDSAEGIAQFWGVVLSSIFNMGVSVFILISGYYGMKFSVKKLVSLELVLWFYSALNFFCNSYFIPLLLGRETSFEIKEMVKSFLPFSSNRFWFLTAYLIIFCLSKYINKIADNLSKTAFFKLILVLLLFFSILPTFLYVEILGDSGKGVINLFIVYLIGRFLAKYSIEPSKIKCYIVLIITLSIEIILNYLLSHYKVKIGIFAPFARDNSIFIIIGAIFTFFLFKKTKFSSKIINCAASLVIGIYLFEQPVRTLISELCHLEKVTGWYLHIEILLISFAVMFVCGIMEFIRRVTIGKIEQPITGLCNKCIEKIAFFFGKKL